MSVLIIITKIDNTNKLLVIKHFKRNNTLPSDSFNVTSPLFFSCNAHYVRIVSAALVIGIFRKTIYVEIVNANLIVDT